jgi:hypothetical protein
MKVEILNIINIYNFFSRSMYGFIRMCNNKFIYKIDIGGENNAKMPLPHHPYHIVDQSP